jgi:uncharacterized protein YhhL (DUF1145 family)
MPKVVLGVIWIWGLASVLVGSDSGVWGAGRVVFWLLVAIHAVECVVFLPRFRNSGGSVPAHLVQTFVFGILHAGRLEAPAESAGD